jgi:hypothetical protein
MAPSGGHDPIGIAHLPAAALDRHSDDAKHRLDVAGGDAGNRSVGIEQGGDARAKRGGGAEQLSRAGQGQDHQPAANSHMREAGVSAGK